MIIAFLQLIFPSNIIYLDFRPQPIIAYVTAYSRKESCHFEGCKNALGREPKMWDAACPRNIPLGTKVEIMGYEFICADRYAKWLDEKRDLPTFDIYTNDYESAVEFGIKKMKVKINI